MEQVDTLARIDEMIEDLCSKVAVDMAGVPNEETTTNLEYLERLMALRDRTMNAAFEREERIAKIATEKSRPRHETIQNIIKLSGSLLGIGLICAFEYSHVITSRSAMGFVPKPRL